MTIAKEQIEIILKAIGKIENEYNDLYELVGKTDLETVDMLHKIELTNFSSVEGYRLAKALKQIRAERRMAKDELITLKIANEFIKSTVAFKNGLINLKTKVNQHESWLENREYNPRTDMYTRNEKEV